MRIILFILIPLFSCSILKAQDSSIVRTHSSVDLLALSMEELLNLTVTSASKQEECIKDIPASIVIFTRDDIKTYNYNSLNDLIAGISGFYSLGSSSYLGGENYGVRGFSSPGSFTNVMILVNGVNQMEDFSNAYFTNKIAIPIQTIDRVEVIRGPMAVMYGSNAFMGVINIITNEVKGNYSKANNFISFTGGSLNTYEPFLRIAGKSHEISYSFNGSVSTSDGMDIPYSDLTSDSNRLTLFGSNFSTRTKEKLQAENKYYNFSGTFKNFQLNLDYSDGKTGVLTAPKADFSNGKGIEITHNNIQAIYTFPISEQLKIESKYTFSTSRIVALPNPIISPSIFISTDVITKAQEYEINTFYNLNKKNRLTVGLYDRYISKLQYFVNGQFFGVLNRISSPNKGLNTIAAFSQLDLTLTQNLQLVAGARIEKTNDYKVNIREMNLTTNQWDSIQSYQTNISIPQFIPRLALLYTMNDHNIVKLMYSQSKKKPSFVELEDHFKSNGTGLDFSEMTAFEINYLNVLKRKAHFNTSVYYNILSDLVIRTVGRVGTRVVESSENKGKASTIGYEVTGTSNPENRMHAKLSVSYQKTFDFTEGRDTIPYAFSPQLLGYLKTYYKIHDRISLGLKARYVSHIFSQWDSSTATRYGDDSPSYFVMDFTARAEIYKGIFTSLYVSNLLDSEVRYGTTQYSGWMTKGMLGYGRRVQLTLGYQF